MIQHLDANTIAIVAIYFQVSDLISLSRVSPCMRNHFGQYAWSKVFLIPHKFLNHGTRKAFKMYEYLVISEELLTKVSRYQWIKREYVRELVLSPMCNLISVDTIKLIDIGALFPHLRSIYGEGHHTIKIENKEAAFRPISFLVPSTSQNNFIQQYIGYFTYQKPSMLINQILSTASKNIQIMGLLLEDELHFYTLSNLSIITSLHISFTNKTSAFTKLINNLSRCTNLQRFIFMPLAKLNTCEYSTLYSVINKRFSQLKFLKILYNLDDGKIAEARDINTVKEMLNKSVEYFEVAIKLERCGSLSSTGESAKKYENSIKNIPQEKIDLSGVGGLEFLTNPLNGIYMRHSYFKRELYAPDLKHFKSRMFSFSSYIYHIFLPVKNNLVTLNVGVRQEWDFSLLVLYLPKFQGLKNLLVEDMDSSERLKEGNSTLFGYAIESFEKEVWKYDWVYSQIRDGNIELDKIQNLSDAEVKAIVINILNRGEINIREENDDFIKTMVMLIKCPEKLVTHYEKYLKQNGNWDDTIIEIIVPLIYSFWDSIYRICQNFEKLEVLKLVQKSLPFISPHFSNLIFNHKSSQLKYIMISTARMYKKWVFPEEFDKLPYKKHLYEVKAPFIYRSVEPYMRLIDYVEDVYLVDIESMRKEFRINRKFRAEEMKYSSGYLDSNFFNKKEIQRFDVYMKGLARNPRISSIGSGDIRNISINLSNTY